MGRAPHGALVSRLEIRVLSFCLAKLKMTNPTLRGAALHASQYVRSLTLKDGRPVTIRPIRPEDEPRMVKFHEALSDRSVYYRYFHMMNLGQRVAHERLARICFVDYHNEMVLVVERTGPEADSEIIAVGRLNTRPGGDEAEFAVIVSDQFILSENRAMQRACEKAGFQLHYDIGDGVMKAEIHVSADPDAGHASERQC